MTQVERKKANAKLLTEVKRRYKAGQSIREIADETDTSYGKIHRMLSEAEGVALRPRGGRHPKK